MSRETEQTYPGDSLSAAELFLRSINIVYDAEAPERIQHFQPTVKSVGLVRALTGAESDRAFFVVAPYGSGKSITATYTLHLIENRPGSRSMLDEVGERFASVSPKLAETLAGRVGRGQQGIVLPLHGHCEDFAQSMKEVILASMKRLRLGREARSIKRLPAEDIEDGIQMLECLKEKCVAKDLSPILIVWDEFGRHVENLISEGRHSALADLQLLAEYVSRSEDVPMVLGLLLHQSLLQYAGHMPQSVRTEWSKIEGRFETLQYIDDSKEIHRLISQVVSSRSRDDGEASKEFFRALARSAKSLGLLQDFTQDGLAETLRHAYPLTPASLYLLPRVSARVAQHERTLFSFLFAADLSCAVTPDMLYDYFSGAMRADTAAGGTHRQWLETQSALLKVTDDDLATSALKTACLLGLGSAGERSRAGRDLLEFALQGCASKKQISEAVDRLIERKLLLHRRHSDEVSVWHGTDLDLRSRLEDEKNRQRVSFDVLDFLMKEARPPAWRPVHYNADNCICRYFVGEFCIPERYDSASEISEPPLDWDGRIIYFLAEDAESLAHANALAEDIEHGRTMAVVPSEPVPVFEAALEVYCLALLQEDPELIDADPLALPEIQQMADDSRGYLQRLLDRVLVPQEGGAKWFYQGEYFTPASPGALRARLSEIMATVYCKTPRINNEMIIRKELSSPLINARKKLVEAILERSGQESLGLDGNTPDASMCRTVLLNTGLYRHDEGRGFYVPPMALTENPGLEEVWDRLRVFFTMPSVGGKNPRHLFEQLQSPPYGVRAGVLPVLFAAALKAFPDCIALTRNGDYVADIVPSEIESILKEPDSYRVLVLDIDERTREYLRGIHAIFAVVPHYELPTGDLLRLCHEAFAAWKAQLPRAAFSARHLSESAETLQHLMQQTHDPVDLFLDKMPRSFQIPVRKHQQLLAAIREAKAQLEDVITVYEEQAARSMRRVLGAVGAHHAGSIREIAASWARCFPDSVADAVQDHVAKGLLARALVDYDTDEKLLESLSHLLTGRSLSRWDDSTIVKFERTLTEQVRRIEEAAVHSEAEALADSPAAEGVQRLVAARIGELYDRLAALSGVDKAKEIMLSILSEPREGVTA